MSSRFAPASFVVAAILLSTLATAVAQSPYQQFQDRYGEELSDPNTQLNPESLAERMLDDAKQMLDEADEAPALGELLLDQVHDLIGGRSTGHETALEAATLLAEHYPDRRTEGLSRGASVLQRQLRSADEADEPPLNEQLAELLVQLAQHHEQEGDLDAAETFYERADQHADRVPGFSADGIDSGLSRLEVAKEIRALEARLEEDRTDAESAERLMRLYLMERNDPASAHRHRFTADDDELKRHTAMANRSPEHLMTTESLNLGNFYTQLAEEATRHSRPAMIERARQYYQLYLDKNPRDEQQIERVRERLAQLESDQEDLPSPDDPLMTDATPPGSDDDGGDSADDPASSPDDAPSASADADDATTPPDDDGDWVDLFANLDVGTFGKSGVWSEEDDGSITGGQPTPAQLMLPFAPEGGYVLETSFTRTSGGGSLAFHLPLGGNYHVLLKLGDRRRRQRDHVAGLEMLDNQPSYNNDSTIALDLESDRAYRLRVEVETEGIEVAIKAELDGDTLIEWEGFRAAVSVPPVWDPIDQEAIGFGLEGGAAATFHYARLQMLFGEYERLEG